METGTQELIYQVITIVISIGLAALGTYAKKLITTKIDVTRYGFSNDKVERILDNAVNYAEGQAKIYAKLESQKLSSSGKLDAAKKYINKVDPTVIAKYGNLLDEMISRKVTQVIR